MIPGSTEKAIWQTQSVSTTAHSQNWLCIRLHMQISLTSPHHYQSIPLQCQHWPSMHATVSTRFNFHAVFWVEYYTSDWTLIARSWPKQICMTTGCWCSNFSFWVTWTVASTYFLNAYSKHKKKNTLVSNWHILSWNLIKKHCTFQHVLDAWSQYAQ